MKNSIYPEFPIQNEENFGKCECGELGVVILNGEVFCLKCVDGGMKRIVDVAFDVRREG